MHNTINLIATQLKELWAKQLSEWNDEITKVLALCKLAYSMSL